MDLPTIVPRFLSRAFKKISSTSLAVYNSFLLFAVILVVVTGYFGDRFISSADSIDAFLDKYVILIGLFVLLFGALSKEESNNRKIRYSKTTEQLHSIFHLLRDYNQYLDEFQVRSKISDDQVEDLLILNRTVLTNILDNFCEIFNQISASKCRASIKSVFIAKKGRNAKTLYVQTMARDTKSGEVYFHDDEQRAIELMDAVEDNEDFKICWTGKKEDRWFFCNNLLKRYSYFNSRDPELRNDEKTRRLGFSNWLVPRSKWVLPYKSTIVWPIQSKRQNILLPKSEMKGVIGFLTIDSPETGKFNQKIDTWVGASIADSLFNVIYKVDKITDQYYGQS